LRARGSLTTCLCLRGIAAERDQGVALRLPFSRRQIV
jgi:hypothetical protein